MHSSRPIRHTLITAALLLSSLAFPLSAQLPLGAQESDETDEELKSEKLEEIRKDKERNQALRENKARGINGATAEIGEINVALEALTSAINAQEIQVRQAEARLIDANARLSDAEAAVTAGESLVAELKDRLGKRAVRTFLERDTGPPAIIQSSDPNLTVRMEALVESVLRGEADLSDAYREAVEDLQVNRAAADRAKLDAEEFQAEMELILVQLDKDKAHQTQLLIASEERLDFLLSEYSVLEEAGRELEDAEKREINRLAALLAARNAAASGRAGEVAAPEDITNVRGILVHKDIAANVEALLAAAEEDGISFGGGGWRDPAAQIRLRKAHCGTSDFAIWEMGPSQCRPPTARPGASLHERGLAIDFNDGGRSITSRSSRGYKWLKANAHKYGLYNLPSEPWHWSTTGR